MEDAPARVIVGRGSTAAQEYTLDKPEIAIGRSMSNDITVDDPEVSRRHAKIIRRGDAFLIEDWGSTNGTFVNDKRVTTRVALRDGDRIRLGEAVVLTFRTPADLMQPMPPRLPPIDWPEEPEEPEPLPEPDFTEWEAPQLEPATHMDSSAFREAPRISEQPQVIKPPESLEVTSSRRRVLTCGCLAFVLIAACFATLFFLDAYEGGRLLYCGPLRPFFELVLGPFGFNPICP